MSRQTFFTKEQELEVCRRYQGGVSLYRLALDYGTCGPTVAACLRRNGVVNRGRCWLSSESKAEMVRRYLAGETSTSICEDYGVGYGPVLNAVRDAGYEARSFHEAGRVYECNHIFFHAVDTEEKAYWLGFFAADGSVQPRGVLVMVLANRDLAHLYRFRAALGSNHPVLPGKPGSSSRLAIASPQMSSDLAALNCPPNKTFTLRFPDLPDNLLRHYVRGVVDGDGCYWIGRTPGRDSFSVVGNIPFLQELRAFLMKHTLVGENAISKATCVGRLRYGGAQKCEVAEFLYGDATVYLERKYRKAFRL